MNEVLDPIEQYVRSAWRFRWWAIALAWGVCLAGWFFVGLQRDVYEANAKFYVDTSSDLRQLLQEQILDSTVDDHLAFVRESMLGQVQLRWVAERTDLGAHIENEMDWQILLANLRKNIEISGGMINHLGRRDSLYNITYQHHDRDTATQVVRALFDAFIEHLLGAKESSSNAAGEFLTGQISEYAQRLEAAEERLASFNRENYNRLPSMQGGYFEDLQTASNELDESRQHLSLVRSRLDRIELQLSGEAPRISTQGEVNPDSIDGRIMANRDRLDELLLRYTSNHPDVVATREILNQLEKRRELQTKELVEGRVSSVASNNPVFQALQISRNELEAEIATIQTEVAAREQRVEKLRGLIDEMPAVEAELARLNRDYDVIHDRYQSLLNSLEREQLSRDVFQSEQIDFRIVNAPSASSEPVAPKREMQLTLVLLAGFGAASALAFALSQLKPVYQSVSELAQFSVFPVLGTVCKSQSAAEQGQAAHSGILFFASVVSLVLLFFCVLGFEIIGPGMHGILELSS